MRIVAPRASQSRGSERSVPVSISRTTFPAPVASHDVLTAPNDGDRPLGRDLDDERVRERPIDRDARNLGKRAEGALDLVRIDGDEARALDVGDRLRDLAGECGRCTSHVDALDGEDRRRVGDPVGDADRDDDPEGDEQ